MPFDIISQDAQQDVGADAGGGERGTDDVDAVKGGLAGELRLVAAEVESVVADIGFDMPGHLVAADDLADPEADPVGTGAPAGSDTRRDLCRRRLQPLELSSLLSILSQFQPETSD